MIRPLLAVAALITLVAAGTARGQNPKITYTAQQAYQGHVDYLAHCAECHGGDVRGQIGPGLANGTDAVQFETGSYVWSFMSVQMPHGAPGTLPEQTYVNIMAYLYQLHGYPAGKKPLTAAAVKADQAKLGGEGGGTGAH